MPKIANDLTIIVYIFTIGAALAFCLINGLGRRLQGESGIGRKFGYPIWILSGLFLFPQFHYYAFILPIINILYHSPSERPLLTKWLWDKCPNKTPLAEFLSGYSAAAFLYFIATVIQILLYNNSYS